MLRRVLQAFKGSRPAVPAVQETYPWPEEPLNSPHGFYAAVPGMVLSAGYTVVRKLGWGAHSSVWLAKDPTNARYVAIKVLSAHATRAQLSVASELAHLKTMAAKSCQNSAGASSVLTLLDHFHVESAHGRHLCLVSDVLGPDLASVKQRLRLIAFPIGSAKSIVAQLLSALVFLHEDCNIIHTDIKQSNVQVVIGEDTLAKVLAHPQVATDDVITGDFPFSPVLSRPIVLPDLSLETKLQVKLLDFGTAASFTGHHAELIQPYALRAPEVILGCGWDSSADIWNLGCIVFELLTGCWLFQPCAGPTWSVELYHLGHMSPVLGDQFDTEWAKTGKHYEKYFNAKGTLRLQVAEAQFLESLLHLYKVEDVPTCLSFLQAMLRLNPRNRATAKDLLTHAWLQ
ncbi:kinase-like domain-containing protein [Mycena vulgaris]|nr:kinase-like domain-containing protein [Mycena vulgaris]